MYMGVSLRFFGVIGTRNLHVADTSYRYLRSLQWNGHYICALPLGAAITSVSPDDPTLGHWAELQDLFGREPLTSGNCDGTQVFNVVCANAGMMAGRSLARPVVDLLNNPLPPDKISDEPAYVPRSVFATYWTKGFVNVAIVCAVDPAHPDELAILHEYRMVVGSTPEVASRLSQLGIIAHVADPQTFARALEIL